MKRSIRAWVVVGVALPLLGVAAYLVQQAMPKGVVVAYANSQPITKQEVALDEAMIVFAYHSTGRAVPPLSNEEAVIRIARAIALFQAARAAGIPVVPAAKAQALAEKGLHALQSPPHAHAWSALQTVIARFGLTDQQFMETELVPAYEETLTVGGMVGRIDATIPKGSMSFAAWGRARSRAVKAWDQKVYAAMVLKVVKPGY